MGAIDPDPTPRMRSSEIIRRTAIATLTVIAVVGLVLVLNQIRHVLLWILIGVILAIALEPAVRWLASHHIPRVLAALAVSIAAIAVIAAAAVAIAWPVVLQADDFIRNLPAIVKSVFGPGGQLNFLETRFNVLERLAKITPGEVAATILGSQDAIVGALTRAASFAAAALTILTIMVMLLIQGSKAWGAILGMMIGDERVWAERIGEDFLRAVGGYVRGNLAISIVAGVSSYILLKILDVPYAETLAVTVAILDVIPLVGATIGAIIVTIVGFAAGGTTDGVILLVYFIAYQQFENNVLQNLVYSKTVSLSPIVVFVAALVGAVLGGIVGVLLAIPIASAGWTLGRDLIALRHARHAEAAAAESRTSTTDEFCEPAPARAPSGDSDTSSSTPLT